MYDFRHFKSYYIRCYCQNNKLLKYTLKREVKEVPGELCCSESLAVLLNYCIFNRHRDRLLEELRAYKPYADLVSKVHILLVGPVGSGKSSFFNSVKSVFHGRVTRQAIVGSDITSITEQVSYFRIP